MSQWANKRHMQCSKNPPLFDHLVGAGKHQRRNAKAERLGGLEIHDHLEFRRKLHREIARLCAAQNAIDISGGATKGVYLVGSVGEQATVSGKVRLPIDRRYVVSSRRRYDERAMRHHEYIRQGDKAASRLASQSADGLFDLCVSMNRRNDWRDLERAGRRLQ